MSTSPNALAVEEILRSWLEEQELTLFCGDWRQGGIMELVPRGGAQLTGQRYEAPFDGLRELRIAGTGHHVHLDMNRLTTAQYRVTPSVCYGFRPSFELRFAGDGGKKDDAFGLGLGLTTPYAGRALRVDAVRRYLSRAGEHLCAFPDVVSFACDHQRLESATRSVWDDVARLVGEVDALRGMALPGLRAALARPAEAEVSR